jgi:hypothetical protein
MEKSKTIIRVAKDENYVTLNNTALRDKNLSWQAKGMHSFLMSNVDTWEIYLTDLKNRSSNGRDATASILNELIKAGYISRTKTRNEFNQFEGYSYVVTEIPNVEPCPEKPYTGNPNSGNPTLISTMLNNDYAKASQPAPKSGNKPDNLQDFTAYLLSLNEKITASLAESWYNYAETNGWKCRNWKPFYKTKVEKNSELIESQHQISAKAEQTKLEYISVKEQTDALSLMATEIYKAYVKNTGKSSLDVSRGIYSLVQKHSDACWLCSVDTLKCDYTQAKANPDIYFSELEAWLASQIKAK